jgi:hypothetical protein
MDRHERWQAEIDGKRRKGVDGDGRGLSDG